MRVNQESFFHMRPISNYLFSLSLLGLLMISISMGWACYEIRLMKDAYKVYVFIAFLVSVYLVNCLVHSFWYFGLYRLNDVGISFYAPLRKSIHFPYNSIRYIGIDFGVVSGSRQFWIYFSTEPIPAKYVHKIHGMPVNRKCMRIQYSGKRYQELLNVLPEKQKKELIKAATILRVYSDHDE